MDSGIEPPPTIHVVSRFGDVFTARLRRSEIVETRQRPGVLSVKAGGVVTMPGRYDPPPRAPKILKANPNEVLNARIVRYVL